MRSANPSSTTSFVQDYAAKRAAQMERAKALREMRDAKDRVMTEQMPPSPTPSANSRAMPSQQQQQQWAPPPAPAASSAQRLGIAQPQQAMGSAVEYPPPLGSYQQQGSLRTPPSSTPAASTSSPQYSQPPPSSLQATRGPSALADRVTISEDDFYRAVGAGIITHDQARQLWAVVSNNPEPASAVGSRPRVPPARTSQVAGGDVYASLDRRDVAVAQQVAQQQRSAPNSYAQLDDQPVGARGGNTGAAAAYDPREYAPPPSFEQQWEAQQQGKGRQGPGAKRSSGRPEWNDNWAEQQQQQQQAGAPQSITMQHAQEQRAGAGGGGGGLAPSSRAKLPRRPDWNGEFADAPAQRQPPQQQQQQAAAPAGGNPFSRGKAQPQRKPFDAGDWNTDTTSGFGEEPPPLPAARGVAARGNAPMAQQQRSAQPQYDEAPPSGRRAQPAAAAPAPTTGTAIAGRRAPPATSTAASGARGGVGGPRGRNPPPPEEPVAVEPDPDEVAEFERLKQQQREEFERALEEGNTNEPMVPCSLCGRNFREGIIDRHMNACRKANKKRKEFNMKEQRLEGIDGIEQVMKRAPSSRAGAGARQNANGAQGAAAGGANMPANKLPKWKLQHQQFQAALKAIKHVNEGGDPRFSAPPPPLPDELDDRTPCPYCGRKYAQDVAERHIPKCKNIVAKPKGIVGRKK